MALVDANYRFIYVDVGAAGRAGDAGVFADSALIKALGTKFLGLPDAVALQGILHHIVGDDVFPLNVRLMKPYLYQNLEKKREDIFNYRLSRAQRVVENAFGILAHRWRVFLTTIKLSPEKVTDIIFAACLHNLMVEKYKASYTSATDLKNADHALVRGTWRNDQVLNSVQPITLHNATRDAKSQRELLTDYFNNHGSLPWQDNMVV